MQDVSLIIYTVADLTQAKRFFCALIGAAPYVDGPHYTGYKNGDMEIGLVPAGDEPNAGALAYWTVSDIEASVKSLVDAGGTVARAITNVGYGLLVASVKDSSGAIVGLRQPPKAPE